MQVGYDYCTTEQKNERLPISPRLPFASVQWFGATEDFQCGERPIDPSAWFISRLLVHLFIYTHSSSFTHHHYLSGLTERLTHRTKTGSTSTIGLTGSFRATTSIITTTTTTTCTLSSSLYHIHPGRPMNLHYDVQLANQPAVIKKTWSTSHSPPNHVLFLSLPLSTLSSSFSGQSAKWRTK